ncbi:hypothetical protein ABZ412_27900 [Nocardia sp. NPDC005746]|uniref:hypothetical protein n=1 Tax=unclassified Nocardia TaxID=2637762 RepID=UPI0033E45C39
MNITKIGHRAALGAALAAAAVQLSAGSATAAADTIPIWFGAGADPLACQATTLKCEIDVEVNDVTTPVSIVINGKTMVTALPAPSGGTPGLGFLVYQWIPDTAGSNTVTVTQGSRTHTVTIPIIDNNSPEAFIRRNQDAVRRFACQSGSSTLSACSSGGVK